ncbi:site-specific recombinase [Chitinophagaceae bacterium MMS25-I14]
MPAITTNTAVAVVLQEIQQNTDPNRYNELFTGLVKALRQLGTSGAPDGIRYITDRMDQESQLRDAVSRMVSSLLNQRDCHTLFTSSGLHTGVGFSQQFFRQLKHRILPPLEDKRSLSYLLQKAFYKKTDYKWIQSVPDELWLALFEKIKLTTGPDSSFRSYLSNALTVLSYRVCSLGLEENINRRFLIDQGVSTPFLKQNDHVLQLLEAAAAGDQDNINLHATQILQDLDECRAVIKEIHRNSNRMGTSLELTYQLERTSQQIKRIQYVVHLFATNDNEEKDLRATVQFFKETVESENRRNNIADLFRQNIGVLAYQIAEHKGNTGEHYITATRKEYFTFLYAAAGGGFIISFIAMFKTLLHHVPAAPFWEYFLYGLNYAFGFVLLQVTHTTLATKQPAMTASTLASYLDKRKHKNSLRRVAHAFVLVWRSQTAAFAGNLAIVFPLSYLLAMGWEIITGHKLADAATAHSYLNNQNPLLSPALLYGCITGVFLFISGIVTGYVDNKVRFSNIAGRIREHPLLYRVKGQKRDKIARYVDHNLGGWAGNIFLGFCLGFAPVFGKIFGVPFDIRHITISTAQFAFGLQGLDNHVPLHELILVITGVLGIGFCNFTVSFGLAFMVALRSRGMRARQFKDLLPLILRYLIRRPFDFIWPPGREITHEEVFAGKEEQQPDIA